MSLIDLIKSHALSEAQAGKWSAVATTLNGLTRQVHVGRVGGKASLAALVGAGIDPNTVIAQMRSVPMASELLNTLNASGVDWSDDLTAFVMGRLVESGKITQRTADVMRSLSVRDESLVSTTAEQCQAAWLLSLKEAALERVTNTAAEAAREEYRKAESTPQTIIATAVAVLENV